MPSHLFLQGNWLQPRLGPIPEVTFRHLQDAAAAMPACCKAGSGLHWSYRFTSSGSQHLGSENGFPVARYGGRSENRLRLVHLLPKTNVRNLKTWFWINLILHMWRWRNLAGYSCFPPRFCSRYEYFSCTCFSLFVLPQIQNQSLLMDANSGGSGTLRPRSNNPVSSINIWQSLIKSRLIRSKWIVQNAVYVDFNALSWWF